MTIRHMKIFIEVYRIENITKAAEQLHMTQPAVSRAIQEIEHYYGVRLFERINRRLSITEIGKVLYQQAVHIVDSFDTLEKGLYNWDAFGILRVGSSITIGNFLLPELITKFRVMRPHTHVESMISNSASLQQALMENQLDIALIENAIDEPELESKIFSKDKLILIMPSGHSLLSKKSVHLSDLLEYDFYLREEGSAGRTFLNQIFAVNSLALHPTSVSISTQAIVKAVSYGLGISILPEKLVRADIEKGNVCTREISDVSLERKHYIVWHRSKYLSPVLKHFMDLCEE